MTKSKISNEALHQIYKTTQSTKLNVEKIKNMHASVFITCTHKTNVFKDESSSFPFNSYLIYFIFWYNICFGINACLAHS